MKNIILIITDTYRYDNLNHRAGRPVDTPYLNRFAKERATSIERCFTGSFPTIPHRTDLATGRLGWPHYGWQSIDQTGSNHISAVLRNSGYSSQLICDCPHLFHARFNVDFDASFHERGQEGDKPMLHLNDPIQKVVPDDKTRTEPRYKEYTLADMHRWTNRYRYREEDTFAAKTSANVVRWLEDNYRASPFFLWVDFFDPHEPWDPPEYMVKKYDREYGGTPMIHPNYGWSTDYSEPELKNLWAHYAAEAELVDRQIGRIIEKLDDLSLWENSVVVVTTDHGMSIGEHQRTGKSNIQERDDRYWPLYPEISHIPFLVAGSGIGGGVSLDMLFQPVDILPTLSELADASIEAPEPLHGHSYAQAIRSADVSGTREFSVSGCYIDPSNTGESPGFPRKASTPFLVCGKWGYAPIGTKGTQELFDLTSDPLAERDVAEGNASIVAELHERFIEHLKEHNAPDNFIKLWGDAGEGSGKWAVDYSC